MIGYLLDVEAAAQTWAALRRASKEAGPDGAAELATFHASCDALAVVLEEGRAHDEH